MTDHNESPDLIPRADAELAVVLAYQRAADQVSMSAPGHWLVVETDRVKAAILALAPAEPLADVEKLRREIEVTNACNNGLGRLNDVVRKRAEAAEADVVRLREALNHIDALDPEGHVGGVSVDAARGLVNRMGSIARAALTTPEKDTP